MSERWELKQKVIPKGTMLHNYNEDGVRFKQFYKEDFPIEVLMKGKEVWMSNTKMEQDTNQEFIEKARGDVLIAGLGMGWSIEQIQDNPKVKSIKVVEIDMDLIQYITKQKKFNDKVDIVHDDIWNFLDKDREQVSYDVIWLDIWVDICGDNLVDMYPMEALAKKLLNRDGEVLVWTMKACENVTEEVLVFDKMDLSVKNKIVQVELQKRGMSTSDIRSKN